MVGWNIEYPTRDVERRKLCGFLLGLNKKQINTFTVEELEKLCLDRGYLKVVDTND